MKIELDTEHDLLYIELKDGDVDRTVDLGDGVHLDLDAEGRALGLEFLSLAAFEGFAEDLANDREFSTDIRSWLRGQDDLRRLLEEALPPAGWG